MKTCTKCGESFDADEIREWRTSGEQFWTKPFICPDCYDNLQRKDLEDQLIELLEVPNEIV